MGKIQLKNENLVVEKCDVFNKEEVRPHVEKTDVVMSWLGFGLQRSEPTPYFLQIAKVLSETMQEAGKRRAIFMHSWYTHPDSRGKCRGFFLRNFFIPYVIGQTLNGMRMSEEFLEKTTHLDYTCIQPAHLLDGPVTDKKFKINDTESCVPDAAQDINRADVARYMLDVIDDEGSYRKIRAIGVD